MKKIILHACCAPCASYPIKKLKEDGYEPVVFFYNPNIFPSKEYEIRRVELEKYCKKIEVEYFKGEYEIKNFYKAITGFEKEPEKGKRCSICFNLRLDKTAQFAKAQGIEYFTTTLSVSPHKNSKQIFEEGNLVAQKYGIEFIEYNFKKQDGFKISRQIAKEENMYAQSYCGCEFSRV
ncbi:epoxyqueuosine reductase QueH [bacterium]|nr:epoxyqueuosine reductase QueH [bacterium]